MLRLTVLLQFVSLLAVCQPSTNQCVVAMDSITYQVITTCDSYPLSGQASTGPDPNARQRFSPSPSASHTQQVYLGSEFFTFPIYQQGTMKLDKSGREITCQLAYNVLTNKVLAKMGNKTATLITPERFTINDIEFTRRTIRGGGNSNRIYCTILYRGQTQFLMSLSRYLSGPVSVNGSGSEKRYSGAYQTKTTYYIQKGEARPELVSLTKKDLLTSLYEYADQIDKRLPNENITTNDVINTLQYYDSLMVTNSTTTLPLNNDAVFNQAIRERITYPSKAWNEGVYGRVYVGFEIARNGKVANVTLLSPENGGYGFEYIVKQSVKKLPILKPDFAGAYVLPVAFTLTSQTDGNQPKRPLNTLPAHRLGDRLVLEEIKIPFSLSRPIVGSHEVWGTYK